MANEMAHGFGNRRGAKLSKADVDAHNQLREVVHQVLKKNGKALGFKVPTRFPKALSWPVLSLAESNKFRFRDPELAENEAGWKMLKLSDFLYKWTHKLLAAFKDKYGWIYEIITPGGGASLMVTVYLTSDGKHRVSRVVSEHIDALIWVLETMSAKASVE